MSRYFSEKFFKYRQAAQGKAIEVDRPCPHCGYNLRGLPFGRACPECGQAVTPGMIIGDPLLEAGDDQRQLLKTGLGLAAISLGMILAGRVGCFIFAAFVNLEKLARGYALLCGIAWCGWVLASWMITPPMLDRRWPGQCGLRRLARVLQVLWPIGAGLFIYYLYKPTPLFPPPGLNAGWLWASLGVRAVAGIGFMLVLLIMHRIAEQAYLETEAKRLNWALWLLPIATGLLFIVPVQVNWSSLIRVIPVFIVLAAILLFWAWSLLMVVLALWSMHAHLRWADIHAHEAIERPRRIERKRREIDKTVEAKIRPLPKHEGDLRMDERTGPG